MNNLIGELIKMITSENFGQVGNKMLFFVNMLLFAVIPSIQGVGIMHAFNLDIPYILDYSSKGIFSFFSSIAFKWLWDKFIKKYDSYKKQKMVAKKQKI